MMSFQTHPTYLDFEAASRPFAERLRACLDTIVRDQNTHARFLNTLSMMEHMGSRRIMITQNAPDLGLDTLKHMAEEARHAFFYKRQAERFAGRTLDYSGADTIAPAFARMYFMRLESFIANDLKDAPNATTATYLYMSMIIEFRAVWAFALFQDTLDGANVKLSLKSLLAEEQGHLADMEAALETSGAGGIERTAKFLDKERDLFVRLLGALERAVTVNAQAA